VRVLTRIDWEAQRATRLTQCDNSIVLDCHLDYPTTEVEPDFALMYVEVNHVMMDNRVNDFLNIAREMDRQGDREAAIDNLSKAIELDPENFTGLMQRGHQYMKKGEFSTAGSDFARAATLQPQNDLPHYYHGEALAKSGDSAGACEAYQRALGCNPDKASSRRMSEYIAAHQGQA
jgi:Flp pilus assembly protein TadD